jgi:phosphohistidine phosphatase
MELYLMRHGEAAESTVDPARPLTERGRNSVERVAESAAARGARVDLIYHSGILRARQTAEILARHIGGEGRVEARVGLQPEDPIEPTAQWLLQLPADPSGETIAVVGHLPFLERLAAQLLAGASGSGSPAFRPGTLVKLVPASGGGRFGVEWVLDPEG